MGGLSCHKTAQEIVRWGKCVQGVLILRLSMIYRFDFANLTMWYFSFVSLLFSQSNVNSSCIWITYISYISELVFLVLFYLIEGCFQQRSRWTKGC